jgi:hypothetical protein
MLNEQRKLRKVSPDATVSKVSVLALVVPQEVDVLWTLFYGGIQGINHRQSV